MPIKSTVESVVAWMSRIWSEDECILVYTVVVHLKVDVQSVVCCGERLYGSVALMYNVEILLYKFNCIKSKFKK